MPQSININKIFFIFFIGTALYSSVPTLETLDEFPRSQAKDFYIWNFLQEKISSKQADELFAQTYRVTGKLFKAYANRSDSKEIQEAQRCLGLTAQQIRKTASSSCAALAINPYKASKMTPKQRKYLAKKLHQAAPSVSKWLSLMDGKHTLGIRFNKEPKLFLYLYNKCGKGFRRIHFNSKLSSGFLNKLSNEEGFDKFVELTALDTHLHKVRQALIDFDSTQNKNTLARFYIAMIKIVSKRESKAIGDLDFVANNDFFQLERDKATFWKYLITHDKALLEDLYKSIDLNIYTLFAAEKLHKEPIGIYMPHFSYYNPLAVDERDPFVWSRILIENKDADPIQACDMLPSFESINNLSIYSFFLERCSNYALHSYITPYAQETKDLPVEKRALFYAIGRQESRLIAGGLSYVYAQGLMQIMPFLSKAIAKQKKEKIYPSMMFEPKKNIEYAKHHLKYLHRKLSHPLFIAYAYNGGIGFLKRILKRGFFKDRFRYDPYLSMEMLPYAETRNYGKKVLANYVIYSKLLGKPISVQSLFENLK